MKSSLKLTKQKNQKTETDLIKFNNVLFKDIQETSHGANEAERNQLIEQLKIEKEKSVLGSSEADLLCLTLGYLGDWQFPHPSPYITPKNVKTAKLEALGANLQRCVGHLEKLTEVGDRVAIELLAQHTLHVSRWLSLMRKKNLNLLKPVARKNIFWPVLKSDCQYFDDIGKSLNEADFIFLRNLELGRDHLIKGRKINLADELGVLILDLLNEVESNRATPQLVPVLKGWRLDALGLPNLAPQNKVVTKWTEVLYGALSGRFIDPASMAKKYKHLVSQKKRVGVKTILGELRHLMKGKLNGIAGMGIRSGKDSTPSMRWCKSRTLHLHRKPA
jgi:hypothetical protein